MSETLKLSLLLLAAVVFIVIATAKLKMHPFLALILAALGYGLGAGIEPLDVVNNINAGFGGTLKSIGIVIVAGTIIGVFLERSGGAQSLAEGALKITGKKNVPVAMALVGWIVSIPVFCDSGFVILSSLNKALSKTAKITLASGAVALSLGLYATHTMVPPTPGPIAAADYLGANLGTVILWGILVSLLALAAGVLFAIFYASKFYIDPEETPAGSEVKVPEAPADKPSTLKSILPIFVPLVLIFLQSVTKYPSMPFGDPKTSTFAQTLIFFGQPIVALFIGVGFALLLPKKLDKEMISSNGWVGQAILSAASILVITGAGGSFGAMLKASDIGKLIGEYMAANSGLGILLPFIIAAAIKTAQGSSTVAIITTAGIMAGLLEPLGLTSDTARALAVISIGAGAMVVSHANDSYFWVVSQFSNMTVKQAYKLQTLGTLVEGCVAAAVVYVISLIVL